jgi:hypothetical protein
MRRQEFSREFKLQAMKHSEECRFDRITFAASSTFLLKQC